MAVSKEYIEALVAEFKANEIKREQEKSETLAKFEALVANGACPECYYDYCECY